RAFISKGRMLSQLKRLRPATDKREDHMISSDSVFLNNGNRTKNGFNLLATRSPTRPTLLDLGGHQQSFLEVGIQSSQHGTRISSIRLLDPPDHKPSTRLGSQGGVPIHIPR